MVSDMAAASLQSIGLLAFLAALRFIPFTALLYLLCCPGGVLAVLTADSLGRRKGTALGCLLSAGCYVAVALIIKLVYFGAGRAMQLPNSWAWTVAALISLACVSAAWKSGLFLESWSISTLFPILDCMHHTGWMRIMVCAKESACTDVELGAPCSCPTVGHGHLQHSSAWHA
jgi:hypothetical protein